MKDSDGKIENIIHGFKNIEDYKTNDAYFGAVIGRTGGRICKGEFELNDVAYSVPTVDRGNALHGGASGFDKKYWDVVEKDNQLEFTYESKDGEEGFPGNLQVKVIYTLDGNQLKLDYYGTSDQDTLLNMTNHAYFNLNPSDLILDMDLKVESDFLIEIDETSIPTGILIPVEDTPFDFRQSKKIGQDIDEEHVQLIRGGGYDHPWKLDGQVVLNTSNGRRVMMVSDQPCVVLYSYNFPVNDDPKHQALAVEFQAEPDGIHHEGFTDSILRKGDTYRQTTVYTFEVV